MFHSFGAEYIRKEIKNSEETKILLQIFIECKHMTHICRIQGYDSIMGG